MTSKNISSLENVTKQEIISWLNYALDQLEIFAPRVFLDDKIIMRIQRILANMESNEPLDFLEDPKKNVKKYFCRKRKKK